MANREIADPALAVSGPLRELCLGVEQVDPKPNKEAIDYGAYHRRMAPRLDTMAGFAIPHGNKYPCRSLRRMAPLPRATEPDERRMR